MVVVIGLVAVGRVTALLARAPEQARYDQDQALEFVARALPDGVTARLTYPELRRLLRWHLEYLASNALTDEERYVEGTGLIVVDDDQTEAYLRRRAADEGLHTLAPADVAAVVDAQMAYLGSIGAIGAAVPEPADVEDDDDSPKT